MTGGAPPRERRARLGVVVAGAEVALAAVIVVLDLLVPTLLLLVLAGCSLALRRVGPASLGLVGFGSALRQSGAVLALVVGWTVVQLALILPVSERLTGRRQDVGQFEELEGNLGLLLVVLALSWTLAAVGEEVAYRGFILTRLQDACGESRGATAIAVLVSSVLFGLAHTEQGAVGVVATFCDGVLFSVLRLRMPGRLWAAVLAHGLSNTIGLTAYYLVGPIHGWW